MAKISPLKGYRYDTSRIKDVTAVITEPYDKITPELQEKYYNRSPYNVVRCIKGKTAPEDGEGNNQYTRARDFLHQWINERILLRDSRDAVYAYNQEYTVGGAKKTRHGFIALGELEEFGKGGVMPHERTLAGPKADRLNLMRATGTQFGLIFMLYPDPANKVTALLAGACKRPADMEATDNDGVVHRLWVISNESVIAETVKLMQDKQLFIADGHHRYETALNYRREMLEKGVTCEAGNENYNNRMMAFVSMQDSGLTILPTHRLIFNLTADQLQRFPEELKRFFAVETCKDLAEMLEKMKPQSKDDHRFGLYLNGSFSLLTLKDEKSISGLVRANVSEDWKRLDVSILHTVLEHLLGIDKKKLEEESNVAYERYADKAVKLVDEKRYQLALFLNPTKASQVAKVAGNGERMPQKSTDFYPKLYTGLVINKLNLPQS
jgi:uncharacterized protein (DUF1015 family)